MPAIINHKICDQASACGGISVCPVGAFQYNEKLQKIEIDNEKCKSCGACEKTCPIGAIGVAQTKDEYENLKRIIEDDPRSPDDLFVDRYGGDVVNQDVIISFQQVEEVIKKESRLLIELFNDDSIMCLLKSIPYSEILNNTKFKKYYRCNIENNNIGKFNVRELPCLLVCNNGKIVTIINGYFDQNDKAKLFELLNNIV